MKGKEGDEEEEEKGKITKPILYKRVLQPYRTTINNFKSVCNYKKERKLFYNSLLLFLLPDKVEC
jgi:hypothetical protein